MQMICLVVDTGVPDQAVYLFLIAWADIRPFSKFS